MRETDTISVTGSGTDRRKPDRAQVEFQVNEHAADRATARAATDRRSAALFETFADHGVAEEAFHSAAYTVNRQRPGPNDTHDERFTVTHVVRVETSDLDGLGDLLTAAVDRADAGVSSVRHTLDDATRDDARDDALTRAAADAERQAETLAAATDRSLGAVESMTTQSGPSPRGEALGASFDTGGGSGSRPAADPRPGPVETNAQVTVTYALE
ncbi:SIMPL domain-containing protein [Halomarina oriensis]|uniref:DUF541 domain-containing protein n=1 Tax=Halomarina oriensis TaxID=671145 RepID=A0A6B0GMX1_9EURY|nr:SIMPL domain-containing protein [Halomarina oriensis]MWG34053.1 DUF541 domain-containing protein [Halomarina oriensis]